MNGIVAHDARVWAILTTPDEYFARARREAWLHAKQDVAADLARRAQRRRDVAVEGPALWRAESPGDARY
jgi:hypothetical protein